MPADVWVMLKIRDKRITNRKKSAVARVGSKGGEVNKREEVIREIIAEDPVVKSVITVDERGELLVRTPHKRQEKKCVLITGSCGGFTALTAPSKTLSEPVDYTQGKAEGPVLSEAEGMKTKEGFKLPQK